jgi:spermidine/putrescine transport system permease protein
MYSRLYKSIVSIPPLLWVGAFLLLPYALMLIHSFWLVRDGIVMHEWNLQNYHKLLENPVYATVLFRTMRIAASVTLLSLLLGYPLAYFLSFRAGARKELLYQLVIVPLWVSYLVRGYAWKTILGSEGVLNAFLRYVHVTNEPVSFLLYSPFAVVLMLTHIYTPFVFLPIYASLEHIPRPLLEASQDLGATPRATFFRVILPLSIPGLLAGATFAARRRPFQHHDRQYRTESFWFRLRLAPRCGRLCLYFAAGHFAARFFRTPGKALVL